MDRPPTRKPRTKKTKELERFRRQFYQSYYVDNCTMYQVTELFLWLFRLLLYANQGDYYATEDDWVSRKRRWDTDWARRKSQGPGPRPEDPTYGELWFVQQGNHPLIVNEPLRHLYETLPCPYFTHEGIKYKTVPGPAPSMTLRSNAPQENECFADSASYASSSQQPARTAYDISASLSCQRQEWTPKANFPGFISPMKLPTRATIEPLADKQSWLIRDCDVGELAPISRGNGCSPYSRSDLPELSDLSTSATEGTIDPRKIIHDPCEDVDGSRSTSRKSARRSGSAMSP